MECEERDKYYYYHDANKYCDCGAPGYDDCVCNTVYNCYNGYDDYNEHCCNDDCKKTLYFVINLSKKIYEEITKNNDAYLKKWLRT